MNNGMIGAIVGDIAGSRFEWHNRQGGIMEDMKKERESAKWVMKVIAISSVLVCVLVGGLMFFCENFLGGNEPEVVESIEEDYSFVEYKVQEGDDILSIAIIHSCRQDLIVKYNNLVDEKVYPGMVLKIPQRKRTVR